MTLDREKVALEAKLARCGELAEDFPDGPTARNLREIEAEIVQQLIDLEVSRTLRRQP